MCLLIHILPGRVRTLPRGNPTTSLRHGVENALYLRQARIVHVPMRRAECRSGQRRSTCTDHQQYLGLSLCIGPHPVCLARVIRGLIHRSPGKKRMGEDYALHWMARILGMCRSSLYRTTLRCRSWKTLTSRHPLGLPCLSRHSLGRLWLLNTP